MRSSSLNYHCILSCTLSTRFAYCNVAWLSREVAPAYNSALYALLLSRALL